MLVKIFQSGDDLLQHLRRGDQEHGVVHVSGEGSFCCTFIILIIGNLDQIVLLIKIRQTAILQILYCRKHPLCHDVIDIPGIHVFELTPTHGLPRFALRENFQQLLSGHMLKAFGFQFLFVQTPNEHQVSQLFNNSQRVGNATCPNICPDFIYFILDRSGNHSFSPFSSMLFAKRSSLR